MRDQHDLFRRLTLQDPLNSHECAAWIHDARENDRVGRFNAPMQTDINMLGRSRWDDTGQNAKTSYDEKLDPEHRYPTVDSLASSELAWKRWGQVCAVLTDQVAN